VVEQGRALAEEGYAKTLLSRLCRDAFIWKFVKNETFLGPSRLRKPKSRELSDDFARLCHECSPPLISISSLLRRNQHWHCPNF
jgi:hypothetical protein